MSAAKAKAARVDIADDQLLRFYRQMVAIRLFEERVNELYTRALMPGLAHLYIGEEAIAVGVCEALQRDDYITSTHRGHGHCLAKGATRRTGCSRSCSARRPATARARAARCTSPTRPPAISAPTPSSAAAPASPPAPRSRPKYLKSGRVAVCFFGDGALGQGLLYEEMNLAAALEAAGHLRLREQRLQRVHALLRVDRRRGAGARRGVRHRAPRPSTARTSARSTADAPQVRRARAPRRAARRSCECKTYRYHGHHVGDIARAYYRPKAEEQEWVTQRDPITLHGEWLMANGVADRAALDAHPGRR